MKKDFGFFDRFLGQYVVVQDDYAGYFAGILFDIRSNQDGTTIVILDEARQLYLPVNHKLTEIAQFGLGKSKAGIQRTSPDIIFHVSQISLCTQVSKNSIQCK